MSGEMAEQEIDDAITYMGCDFSSTEDSSVFNTVEFIDGKMNFKELTRKEYFIELIKEQPFF